MEIIDLTALNGKKFGGADLYTIGHAYILCPEEVYLCMEYYFVFELPPQSAPHLN